MKNNVLEQLKQEYNETLNRMQDLGDILAHCAEMDTRKDINWYHVEQDDEFNFGRMEDKYYTNNYFN